MNTLQYPATPTGRQKITILFFTLLCILVLCTAFAGFSTKGEPREALVAVEMLRSSNWILPVDQSGDMAYKPPMFHWLIALLSLPAGRVTELTARLPSALALSLMCLFSTKFFGRRENGRGLLTAILMLTTFEVFRSGTVCRVDMLLTMFITGAIMSLYNAYFSNRLANRTRWYVVAILAMSGAALTKGPVGIILPLGVIWLFRAFRGDNILRTTLLTIMLLICSAILPALWYYAAYRQGGDRFLSLAIEENFGRFLGKMSYGSHEKPFWYNITSLLLGWMPWSLLVISSLWEVSKSGMPKCNIRTWWYNMLHNKPLAFYSLICILVIFTFYSIPKSKRSVYLLPMYPFMAYALAVYVQWLIRKGVITDRCLKRICVSILSLFITGFGIIFPFIANHKSDKEKAAAITAITHSGPIYSYVPDRFMRYYITDFYLGSRIVSLMPSMQVNNQEALPLDTRSLSVPPVSDFYMITAEEYLDMPSTEPLGINYWLNRHNLKAETAYISPGRAHDIKKKIILLHITPAEK